MASLLIDSSVAVNSDGVGEMEVAWDQLLIVEAMAGCLVADWVIVDKDGGGGVRENSFCFAFLLCLFLLALLFARGERSVAIIDALSG